MKGTNNGPHKAHTHVARGDTQGLAGSPGTARSQTTNNLSPTLSQRNTAGPAPSGNQQGQRPNAQPPTKPKYKEISTPKGTNWGEQRNTSSPCESGRLTEDKGRGWRRHTSPAPPTALAGTKHKDENSNLHTTVKTQGCWQNAIAHNDE